MVAEREDERISNIHTPQERACSDVHGEDICTEGKEASEFITSTRVSDDDEFAVSDDRVLRCIECGVAGPLDVSVMARVATEQEIRAVVAGGNGCDSQN